MVKVVQNNDVFGLVRPTVDAHTLGVSTVAKLIEDCGYKVVIGNATIADAVANIARKDNVLRLAQWLQKHEITRLGFSYRLDPNEAFENFNRVTHFLKENRLFKVDGGRLIQVYFSGLPQACERVQTKYKNDVPVFVGDETLVETAKKLGIPDHAIPNNIIKGSKYDDERYAFARELIEKGEYNYLRPNERFNYPNYGTKSDSLAERILHNRKSNYPPLMRVHVGPYNPNYFEALMEFNSWLKTLSETKYLDIVSIGSSQLSQSDFGKNWGDKPNGGGVPINSELDLVSIYEASRPMLVRTYAGTRNISHLASIYENTINIAWHALSFWWFNLIDGRGPYSVKKNLEEHLKTLDFIAKTGKPFEPNIPHHFAFRGADDFSYVLSSYLAAITAKRKGIRHFVLQVMLNTPKYTWGIQDLAKARALLTLVRELEDKSFKVYLQPRAGLDYFSPDLEKAKAQLAAVTAMMDDIEPFNDNSPDIIHVVSYCEAVKLATPFEINESIQITTKALFEYRKMKQLGNIDDMKYSRELQARTTELYNEVKAIVRLIESNIENPYSAEGLYTIFEKGIMPVPYLWEGREEFKNAVSWKTGLVNGGVHVIDEKGKPIKPSSRVAMIFNKGNNYDND